MDLKNLETLKLFPTNLCFFQPCTEYSMHYEIMEIFTRTN